MTRALTIREHDNALVAQRREYDAAMLAIRELIADFRIYVDSMHDADLRALEAALKSMEKRLDGMNEFRATLESQGASFFTREAFELFRSYVENRMGTAALQAATFVTTDKYDTESQAGAEAIAAIGREVERRLTDAEKKQANADGKMAVYATIGGLLAATAVAAAVKALGG